METNLNAPPEDLVDVFDQNLDIDLLRSACREHSHVISAPDTERFDRAVWNAIELVMGDKQSAMLRTVAGTGAGSPAVMPGAASLAALLWLRENMPRTAAKVLAQGRQNYTNH